MSPHNSRTATLARWLLAVLLMPPLAAPAAAQERSGQEGAVPAVEALYQERVAEAWAEALAGENPAATCAGVKGRAATAEPGTATKALEACNVDIPTRYFLTWVDRVEAGEKTCIQLMTEVLTKLSSMTLSTKGLRDVARASQEGADTSAAAAQGAATALVAGAAADGGGANDPAAVVKERLREPVTAACPDQAAIILR